MRETGGEERELTWAVLRDHFIYALAHTCHSLQGMSVSDGIALFDINYFYVTREWLYTALTRATSLGAIRYRYWPPEAGRLHELADVREAELRARAERKIAGHRTADLRAGRRWEEADYVTVADVEALLEEQGGRCAECATYLQVAWRERAKPDPDQFSVDRLDNALPHLRGNVRCNVSSGKAAALAAAAAAAAGGGGR